MAKKSFKYSICDLHGAARKAKLSNPRVRMNRKSGGNVCSPSKYPRCTRKKSGYATCVKRPRGYSRKKGGVAWTI